MPCSRPSLYMNSVLNDSASTKNYNKLNVQNPQSNNTEEEEEFQVICQHDFQSYTH